MPRKPSVHDVAQRAGVSVGTVSHALNHPERVTASTLAKVNAAIDELGFIRSGSARQLRAGESTAVGLVVRDLANPFYMEAARALEDTIAEAGLALMVSSTDGDADREERVLRMLLEQEVLGIIITPSQHTAGHLAALRRHRMRAVLLDTPRGEDGFASVGVDDVEGGRLAVDHLLASGHRRIAMLNGPLSVRQSAERWAGAQAAVRDHDLDPDDVLTMVNTPSYSADHAAVAMAELLDSGAGCTASFCANDVMAIGAMRTLRERGLRIPDDMALVGYDDIPVAAQLITPLTSVSQPMAELGRTAAELLLADAPTTEAIQFRPQLVVRESAPA